MGTAYDSVYNPSDCREIQTGFLMLTVSGATFSARCVGLRKAFLKDVLVVTFVVTLFSLQLWLQDCLFLKQPGFGATNWHSDLNMVRLEVWASLPCASVRPVRLHLTGQVRDYAPALSSLVTKNVDL